MTRGLASWRWFSLCASDSCIQSDYSVVAFMALFTNHALRDQLAQTGKSSMCTAHIGMQWNMKLT
ncbi:hypothetical protein AA19596_0439 [Acetobacter fabarum DSM 19596]|nr:hypothetical protein AA19596_0439 [Acetobacter fabarum DSM 19596]